VAVKTVESAAARVASHPSGVIRYDSQAISSDNPAINSDRALQRAISHQAKKRDKEVESSFASEFVRILPTTVA
jgi:hypothetical protein